MTTIVCCATIVPCLCHALQALDSPRRFREAKVLDKETVHDALEVMYDSLALSQTAFVAHFSQLTAIAKLDERGERARALLLEAIEVLRPARSVPFGSLEARSYDVLSLRYVENLPLPQVMSELCLSRRQVYRDLAEAEEKLAKVIGSWATGASDDSSADEAGAARPGDSLSDELASLATSVAPTHLLALVDEVFALLRPLADSFGTSLDLLRDEKTSDDVVLVDPAVLRQVLIVAMSTAIQSQPRGGVQVRTAEDGPICALSITFDPTLGALDAARMEQAGRIALTQGIDCRLSDVGAERVCMQLRLRRGRAASVLVVEDNAGAVELYRRYLSSGSWQVQAVPNPKLAYEMASRSQPDVIILDIIMPGLDGWSVIKTLHERPETSHIPLVVCSVLADPKLAESLGATVCLAKPVGKAELIAALNRCLNRRHARQGDG